MTSVSALPKLCSLKDLKQIDFGVSVHTNSLVLLRWFAKTIKIDNCNTILLTFNPNTDYGGHYYGNYDNPPVLPELPQGNGKYDYYTIGNQTSNHNNGKILPSYVTEHGRNSQLNKGRILLRVKEEKTIDEVYITQHLHLGQGSVYDRKHTYQISINLLKELRNLRCNQIMHSTVEEDADYELLLNTVCMKLEVKTGERGNAKIHWQNIPECLLDIGVMVVLFKNNMEVKDSRKSVDMALGHYDTKAPLNPGLQVRLHKAERWFLFRRTMGEEIFRGEEFHNHKSEMTISMLGNDAKLQLFVKDGKACARLYVSNTFTDWKSQFKKSWVGFYSSAMKATDDYETWQWQWATKFSSTTEKDSRFAIYEYHSSMAIAAGVQARFILSKNEDIARTPTWKW